MQNFESKFHDPDERLVGRTGGTAALAGHHRRSGGSSVWSLRTPAPLAVNRQLEPQVHVGMSAWYAFSPVGSMGHLEGNGRWTMLYDYCLR